MITTLSLVVVAGGLGAAGRYTIDYMITQRVGGRLPWGTAVVNLSGSLALGLLAGMAMRINLSQDLAIIVGGGFLGAYTTFSTWMYQSLQLMENGRWAAAAVNVFGSALAGGAAAMLGLVSMWWLLG